jgi:hypothetical protein
MRSRDWVLAAGAVTATVVGATLAVQSPQAGAASEVQSAQPRVIGAAPGDPDPGVSAEKAAVEREDARRHEELNKRASDHVLAKAAVEAKQAAAAARAVEVGGSPAAHPPAWPAGIFEDSEAPASGADFLGRNRWVGVIDGRSVAVHAGQAGAEATTGRLLVMLAAADMTVDRAYTRDVAGSGPLRVTAATGTTITLIDSHGAEHLFDITTEAFTS